MANSFTADGSPGGLRLSNGATDVLFDVLTLAGCARAEAAWEQHLALHVADGHRFGGGTSGFDLSEPPWTADRAAGKAFFLRLIDTALGRGELGCRLCDPGIGPIG